MANFLIDVCVSNPGGEGTKQLEKLCDKYKWSYLYLKDDRLSQAQNQAIKLHPNAKYIYKIDEDIVLPDYYFTGMREAFEDSQKLYGRTLGFLGPLINVNGYGYNVFIDNIGTRDEFEQKYGKQCFSEHFMKDPIHHSPELGVWIWNHTIPFDDTAKTIRELNSGKRGLCTFRFSVGAVMFSRSFWEQIGYFDVNFIGAMGLEEDQMNAYCMNNFRSIIIAEDVLVGHLGFGSQKEAVKEFFLKNYEQI